jgi:hypothetical protein
MPQTASDFRPDLPEIQSPLARPLELIIEAIRLLDDLAAPGDIAAHLDLAMHRLRQEIFRQQG